MKPGNLFADLGLVAGIDQFFPTDSEIRGLIQICCILKILDRRLCFIANVPVFLDILAELEEVGNTGAVQAVNSEDRESRIPEEWSRQLNSWVSSGRWLNPCFYDIEE